MKRTDINQLLERLNEKLAGVGQFRSLVVCGGAALILSNFGKEETVDVDLVSPNRDELLQKLTQEVAREMQGIRADWLNSHAASFFEKHNPLPDGWELRLVKIFKASHLEVKSLAPEDILFSKICSHIEREMDEEDIRVLATSEEMFENAVKEVVKLEGFQDSTTRIIIDELRIRLGFDHEES